MRWSIVAREGNGEPSARLTSGQAGAQPFDPAPPGVRMDRAVARFTSSAPTEYSCSGIRSSARPGMWLCH